MRQYYAGIPYSFIVLRIENNNSALELAYLTITTRLEFCLIEDTLPYCSRVLLVFVFHFAFTSYRLTVHSDLVAEFTFNLLLY